MFYIIYKTTNLINNKIYIGKHQTKDLNDGYIGSGKLLKRAIKKYGIENFTKEIIHQFDNEADMNAKEAEIVNEDLLKDNKSYNLCPGGKGGFGYINSTGKNLYGMNGKTPNCEAQLKLGRKRVRSIEERKRLSKIHKEQYKNGRVPAMLGKSHSEKIKQKIGEANSKLQNGKGNSQFGTMWITNGIENKKIKKVDIIPEGWYKGRTYGPVA